LVSSVLPLLGPLLVALVLGFLLVNLPPLSRFAVASSPRADRLLLRSGVVLLGLKISVSDVAALGVAGLSVVLVTVAATYAATQVAGRALGVDRKLVTLIAAGFSVCGAAAIAAVEVSIRAKAKDVAMAIALVTVFGSAMIVAVPLLGRALELSDHQTAVWAGASIHEVAQVIAAASIVSGAALATATTVKLARVVLLVPVQLLSSRVCRERDRSSGPPLPAFLVAFAVAIVLRSTSVLPARALQLAFNATTLLLGAAMFGLGTTIVARQLWPVPWRGVVLAAIATSVAAGSSLVLVAAFV
jgi:uncharacterized integral membrane protein (TIGR00698 family)